MLMCSNKQLVNIERTKASVHEISPNSDIFDRGKPTEANEQKAHSLMGQVKNPAYQPVLL